MSWVLVVIALIGTVLNVRRQRLGFVFWVVSNAGLMVVNAGIGQLAQAVMFGVYLGLAVWGLVAWRTN